MAQKKSIESLSFEDALKELETIVRTLESGQGELEQSINDFARATALKDHCAAKLADAKLRVEKLTINTSGNPEGTVPFAHEGEAN